MATQLTLPPPTPGQVTSTSGNRTLDVLATLNNFAQDWFLLVKNVKSPAPQPAVNIPQSASPVGFTQSNLFQLLMLAAVAVAAFFGVRLLARRR